MKDKETTFEAEIINIGEDLVKRYSEKIQTPLSELERQIILIYTFGMANALREKTFRHLSPLQTETAMTAVMIKLFDFSVEKAQTLMNGFIEQMQNPEPNTIKHIIYCGFDAYSEWENNCKEKIADEIVYLLSYIKPQ